MIIIFSDVLQVTKLKHNCTGVLTLPLPPGGSPMPPGASRREVLAAAALQGVLARESTYKVKSRPKE
jgi:hypothetical protein